MCEIQYMMRKQQLEPIQFMAAVQVKNDLYFSAWHINALFKQDGSTGKIEFIASVKQEERESRLHSHAFLYENQIYFIPDLGRYITKLNLADLSIDVIVLPESKCCSQKFVDIVYVKEALWLIPSAYDALIRLDLKTDGIEKYANWPKGVAWTAEKKDLFCGAVCVSDTLCLCPYESDFLVTFDLEKKEMKGWDWDYPIHAFYKIILHKDSIWFLPEGKYPYIIKYSLETKQIVSIDIQETSTNNGNVLYAAAAIMDDTIILTPYQSNQWIFLDTITKEIKKATIQEQNGLYIGVNYFKDGVIITEGWSKPAQFISAKTHEISEIFFLLSKQVKKEYLEDLMQQSEVRRKKINFVLKENDFSLELYADAILSHNSMCERTVDVYGEMIYNSLTESVLLES